MTHASTVSETPFNTDVARMTAPEDVRVGDYIALLTETCQYPTFFWNTLDNNVLPPEDPVLIKYKPHPDDGPYKVLSVCLPFVFVEQPNGCTRIFDVRQCELARVSDDFARMVFKRRSPSSEGKSKKNSGKERRKKSKRRKKRK
ncbi:MAG: hypothetical protein AAF456_21690 [Planctomycetota bacterium]